MSSCDLKSCWFGINLARDFAANECAIEEKPCHLIRIGNHELSFLHTKQLLKQSFKDCRVDDVPNSILRHEDYGMRPDASNPLPANAVSVTGWK
jgi:hypothetical protein